MKTSNLVKQQLGKELIGTWPGDQKKMRDRQTVGLLSRVTIYL